MLIGYQTRALSHWTKYIKCKKIRRQVSEIIYHVRALIGKARTGCIIYLALSSDWIVA